MKQFFFFLTELTNSLINGEDEFDKAKIQQDQILEEMVPQMNKDATKLVDVYKLTDLIENEVLDSLSEEAVTVLKTSAEDLP